MKSTLIFALGVLLATNALAMQPDEDSSEEEFVSGSPLCSKHVLKQRAKGGNVLAQYQLGWFYYDEKKEPKKALRWLLLVAEKGYVEAQVLVGKVYTSYWLDGEKPDFLEARKWFKKAAAQGDIYALSMLE